MIELSEMAEFVDDDIISQSLRQKKQFIIEVQVALARTAAPTAFLVLDHDPIDLVAHRKIEIRHELAHQDQRGFFISMVVPV